METSFIIYFLLFQTLNFSFCSFIITAGALVIITVFRDIHTHVEMYVGIQATVYAVLKQCKHCKHCFHCLLNNVCSENGVSNDSRLLSSLSKIGNGSSKSNVIIVSSVSSVNSVSSLGGDAASISDGNFSLKLGLRWQEVGCAGCCRSTRSLPPANKSETGLLLYPPAYNSFLLQTCFRRHRPRNITEQILPDSYFNF